MIYISFIEEAVLNPKYQGYIGGRVEVYNNKDGGYCSEEIRFFTNGVVDFNNFRDTWDMREVNTAELDCIRDMINEWWFNV